MADEDVIYNQIWFYIINEMKESKWQFVALETVLPIEIKNPFVINTFFQYISKKSEAIWNTKKCPKISLDS
jgi:hypothetical protein